MNLRDRTIAAIRESLADGSARARREKAGVSQGWIAKAVGVGQPAVSMFESGRRVPTPEHALAYGKALAAAERAAT